MFIDRPKLRELKLKNFREILVYALWILVMFLGTTGRK